MRKSHSTTTNLSDISKLKISSSNTSSNINNVLISSENNNNINSKSYSINQQNVQTRSNFIKPNCNLKSNYRNSVDLASKNANEINYDHIIEPLNYYDTRNNYQSENFKKNPEAAANYSNNVNGSRSSNNYQNTNGHIQYNGNENFFSTIQEEKTQPTHLTNDNNIEETTYNNVTMNLNTSNSLKVHNELVHNPSSSSSNSSLNNNNNRLLMNGNSFKPNYESSLSNTTTGS